MKDLALQINFERDFDVAIFRYEILNTIYKLIPFLYLYSEKTELLNSAN